MFCCTLLYVHSSIAIVLMGKRELIALLYLSSCCLMMVERLFLAVPWGCLQFVIVLFPYHTHLLFLFNKFHVNDHECQTLSFCLYICYKYCFTGMAAAMKLKGKTILTTVLVTVVVVWLLSYTYVPYTITGGLIYALLYG